MKFHPRGEYLVLRKVHLKTKSRILQAGVDFAVSEEGPKPRTRDWPIRDALYKVLEVGPGGTTLTGDKIPMRVKPGEVVLTTGRPPKLEGTELYICLVDMVACTVSEVEVAEDAIQA